MDKLTLTTANGGIRTNADGKPTTAAHGMPLRRGVPGQALIEGFSVEHLSSLVLRYNATVTAGQVATLAFLKAWVFDDVKWHPVGPAPPGGSDADRGKLNNGIALGEDQADQINLCQVINGLSPFTRFCLEENTPGGAGYASSAVLQYAGG